MDYLARRQRLTDRLRAHGLEALIITRPPNVRYLTGFTGSNGQVVVARDGPAVFLTDGRYEEQARHEVPDLDLAVYRQGYPRPLLDACRTLGARRAGFERRGLTYDDWTQLDEGADGLELIPTGHEVETLRRVKDADELGLIALAQSFSDLVFDRVALNGGLRAGVTERQVARDMETQMLHAGTERAFEPIVAFGDHAAEPHHRPTDRELTTGDVVKLDFGAVAVGYHSDMTRTLAFGEPDPRLREIRDVVAAANQAGIDAVRPGKSTVEVDAAARTVVVDAGYGDAFPHGLGHGVGLEIHEDPFLRWHTGVELEQGMVVTIEPGVYIPGLGGVRIEDMVEVAADGSRTMPRSSKELIVL